MTDEIEDEKDDDSGMRIEKNDIRERVSQERKDDQRWKSGGNMKYVYEYEWIVYEEHVSL